jgi:outer membrane autotransporter protein
VQPQPGNYALQTSYTILTASGGVTGKFADATTTSAFLGPTLTYDANDVFLTLSKTGTFLTRATTPNQRSVAAALDASPFNSALVLAALNQTATTAGSTFDALSGEIHGSVQTTMLDDSVFVREALLGRLRQASFAGEPGPLGALGYAGPRLAYGPGDACAADLGFPVKAAPARTALTPDWTWWTQAVGSWGQIDGNGNAGGVRRDLGGAFTGVDRRFGDNWRAGVASGYSYSSVSDNARLSSAHIDTAYAAAYAGANYGAFSFRSGATGAWNMVNTGRSIVFPGFVDAATARYDAATAQVFGEAAYAKALGNLAVEPFAGLAWVHLTTGSFAEVGGVAALGGARKDDDVGYSSLGVRFATSFALANGMMLIPRAAATWEHAFGDVNPVAALTFLSTAASFTAGGVPLAGDTAIIDAGFDVRINPHAKIGLSYFGQLASGAQDHAVKGNFTWNF